MSAGLHSLTYDRLLQFLRRQRTLLTTKGVASTILVLVMAILMLVAADAIWVLPTSVRWLLASTTYALVGLTCLGMAVRPWFARKDIRLAAKTMEGKVPPLHERLLSAVELAEESDDRSSPAFRQHLQLQVAETLKGVEVAQLLPWKLVRHWIAIASIAIAVLVGLCMIPSWNLPYRIVRALFPAANLGRLSRYQIDIISPQPTSKWVPKNEMVSFRVQVDGPRLDRIDLETLDGKRLSLLGTENEASLNASPNQSSRQYFTTNLMMEAETLDYRVIAGDGSTSWYRLRSKARPSVLEFEKTIQHPAYAECEPTNLIEDHGGLEAIIGSTVLLKISTDQLVSTAELQLRYLDQPRDAVQRLPFRPADDGKWEVELPIERDATYRIHLVASETGFDNAQSPSYRIRARTDQPPRVKWSRPVQRSIVEPPQGLLDLQAKVEDEYTIGALHQWYRVNHGEWLASQLPISTLSQTHAIASNATSPSDLAPTIDWKWDLAKLSLHKGDLVQTRLLAEDRKGQRSESSILEIIISAVELSAGVTTSTELRTNVATELRELAKQVAEKQAELAPLKAEASNAPDSLEKQERVREKAEEVRSALDQAIPRLERAIQTAMRNDRDSVSQSELEAVANVMSKLKSETLPEMKASLDRDPANDPQGSADSKTRTARGLAKLDEATQLIQKTNEKFRMLASYDVLRDLGKDFEDAYRFQQEVLEKSSDLGSETWKRREEALVNHLQELAKELKAQKKNVRDQAAPAMQQWSDWATSVAAQHQNTLDRLEQQPAQAAQFAKEGSQRMLDELRYHRQLPNIDGGIPGESIPARKELEDISGKASEVIQKTAEAVRQSQAESKPISEAKRKSLEKNLEQLADRRGNTSNRADADAQFAADLGNARRAAEKLLEAAQAEMQDPEKKELEANWKSLTEATQKLEAMHAIREASTMLRELQADERWESGSYEGRTDHPRSLEALANQFARTAEKMRQSGFPGDVTQELAQLQWSPEMSKAQQKIGPRRWDMNSAISAASDLDEVQKKLDAIQEKLSAAESSARDSLTELAPSIPALARKAAEQSKKLEQEAKSIAEAAARGDIPDPSVQAQQQLPKQEKAETSIDRLSDALADFASTRDLLKSSERQQAKDADTGRVVAEGVREQVKDAMQEAMQPGSKDQSTKNLEKLAAADQSAAQAMEQIANHFENLQNLDGSPQELEKTRAAMKDLAKQFQPQDATDRKFAEADRMGKLADADPRALLKRLEQELTKNPEMREELSEISKDLLNQSKELLKFSAEQEKSLQMRAEESDFALQQRKQTFSQELSIAAEQAQNIAQRLQGDAQATASQARQPERQSQLQQAAQKLNEAIQKARQVPGNAPLRDMEAAAQNLRQAVRDAEAPTRDASQKLAASAGDKIFEKPEQLEESKKQLGEVQRRTQEQDAQQAQARENWRNDRAREADQRVQQIDNQLNQLKQQRDQAKQNLDRAPNQESSQLQYQQAEARVQIAESQKQAFEAMKQQAAERAASAKAEREQIQARQPQPFAGTNPAAELSSRLSEQVAAQLSQLGGKLEQLATDTAWKEQFGASQPYLNAAKEEQRGVLQNVGEAARNIDRAAAHERRLQNEPVSKNLAQQAQQVASAANGPTMAAQQSLNNAAESLGAKGPAQRASNEASKAATQSLQNAEQAIRQQAEQVAKAAQATEETPPPAATIPAEGSSKAPLDAKTMARMLDELDRQLRNPSANIPSSKSGNSESSASKNPIASSLKNAADELTKRMNQERNGESSKLSSREMVQSTKPSSQSMNDGQVSGSAPDTTQRGENSNLASVDLSRVEVGDWSKLREQTAENTTESNRDAVSPKYRKKIEAYYRVLSERSQK